jgi:ribonuclease Z
MTEKSNTTVYDIWKFSMKLPGTQLSLRGHSRGSEKSCFYIPELKTFLDAGCESYLTPDYILISHCHSDHSFQLPQILTGLNRNRVNNPIIYAPDESVNLFQNFLMSSYKLRMGNINANGKYFVRGALPGMEIDLKKDGYFAIVYNLHHNVPTRGYGICKKNKKLKKIYYGLHPDSLRDLKKSNVNITEIKIDKVVAYTLDTTIECFQTNPELLEYKYVIIECTFFMDEPPGVTRNHIHWTGLKKIVINNPKVMFILVHFSMRYTWDEIILFFDEQKKDVNNIIVWKN